MNASPSAEPIELAAQAATAEEAAAVLEQAGWKADYAAEAAAVMFGESTGDLVQSDDVPALGSNESDAQS